MADGLNKVMLIGNLGADPEMRYTANGSAVTTFRLAVSRSFGSEGGERREETEWVSVVTWNKLAELLQAHLNKGRKVYVEGRLSTRSWDGPDGQKRYRTEVVADHVMFLDRAGGPGGGGEEHEPSSYNHEPVADVEPEEIPFE